MANPDLPELPEPSPVLQEVARQLEIYPDVDSDSPLQERYESTRQHFSSGLMSWLEGARPGQPEPPGLTEIRYEALLLGNFCNWADAAVSRGATPDHAAAAAQTISYGYIDFGGYPEMPPTFKDKLHEMADEFTYLYRRETRSRS